MNGRFFVVLGMTVVVMGAAGPEDCNHIVGIGPGTWGGEHMGMVVSDTGASIEYDCATGRITQPLSLDPDGNFSWQGLFFPGHGGPSRIDEKLDPHVATYSGNANGDHMTINLRVADSLNITQQFTLTRGANPNVFKCL
jgi:hypothetical protein